MIVLCSQGRLPATRTGSRCHFERRRAEGDVIFTCEDGEAIENLVSRVIESGERASLPVHVTATVPSLGDEPVTKLELTLSLKRRD